MNKLIHNYITADNTDFLQGTDLETAPGDGVYDIRIASTQADTGIDVTSTGHAGSVVRGQEALLRANGEIRQYDPPITVAVLDGDRVTINIDVVTAATVGVMVAFRPAFE